MAEIKKIRNLNDLAKRMGCTATMVSMALRDSPQLSQELREKIKKLAGEIISVPGTIPEEKAPARKNAIPIWGRFSCFTMTFTTS